MEDLCELHEKERKVDAEIKDKTAYRFSSEVDFQNTITIKETSEYISLGN